MHAQARLPLGSKGISNQPFSPGRLHPSQNVLPRRIQRVITQAIADVDAKSDEYSDVMSARMGAALTYRHEDGMNYNRILKDLIVGSCLQQATDVDILADKEGVRTVLCLQEDSDMAYFSLDVAPIRSRCTSRSDILHLRHAIRDFDPFSLRRRLPGAVALLSQQAAVRGGTSYVHCTAGLGRAPATALAYMWWIKGIPLDEAYALLTGIRPCKPKADAIREAAVDMLYGKGPLPVTLTLHRRGTAQSVQVAGLDVGWGQSVPLEPSKKFKNLSVERNLPPGTYQFKFIWDGIWGPCMDHLTMVDGDNLNNYIIVPDEDLGEEVAAARRRLRAPGGDLTAEEAEIIKNKLKKMKVDDHSTSAPGVNELAEGSSTFA
jgi:Glycogen recognition site of AMP-activated protein kinase/Dual specificity phosphatase, catalytic domain